ncbi:MAG TPA: prepilin-type N-terminal cleavage/methylation domain-containing protein, partial [Candidatus Sulfopaludibacter sp.]|nr:prepilin-type N-terminal cleavage/methylation domain-containing protein [Candidatus Sulfopaludibacter sp.]
MAFARAGFTMVEMLVTLALLSLIVLALMTVFNSTQSAFRASLTQTDILESGRLAMGLITSDLETMTPSLGLGNSNGLYSSGSSVNFYANTNSGYAPLIQALTASSQMRTNVLENFFSLSRQNIGGSPTWVGTGYAVAATTPPPDTNGLYALYRFSMTTNIQATDPYFLYSNFVVTPFTNTTYWSHLVDGVVDLMVRPYDLNGLEMTNTYEYNYNGTTSTLTNRNTCFFPPALGMAGFYMYSNMVPASVEVEMGVLEDTTLQRAEALSGAAQMNYLSNHVGQVHLFRQRVMIRNVDP